MDKNKEKDILITDRHGEKYVSTGDFTDYYPDAVKDAGEKLRTETEMKEAKPVEEKE